MNLNWTQFIFWVMQLAIVVQEKDKHLGLRIDQQLHYKLQYISQYEGRSINGEVLYLIRREVERFEKEHGKIEQET